MLCPKCGSENPDQNKFCGKCGTEIQSPATKPIKRDYLVGFLWLFIILLVLGAVGCLVIYHSAQNPFGPSLHVGERSGINKFGTLGIQFQVYNSGNGPAKNVEATIDVMGSNGELLTSKTVYVGNLDPGESKSITTSIRGSYPESSTYSIILGQK